jgi:hypothetical protein
MLNTAIKPVKPVKPVKEYNCLCCSYYCRRKYDLNQHLATLKHKKAENILVSADSVLNSAVKPVKPAKPVRVVYKNFTCVCGKFYKHKRSLLNHKKNCNHTEPVCVEIKKPREETGDLVALLMEKLEKKDRQMMELLEKKDEQVELLTNTIKDMIPKMGSNNNNTNQFNINTFLNEECKDAINMSDFIKSIQVSIDQLQYTTNNGLSKGITKVIMDNMNKLSKYERPLHCSDLKRETIYIKDDDKWEKDTHKDKLKKAINKTSNKNYTALCDWTSENPNFMKQDDKQHFYAKTTSLIGKPICDIEDKIIKSICKDNFIKE